MYQAQQEAELGELQNQENVKNNSSNQSDCNSSVCLETLKTQHWKTKGRVKQRTVLVFSVETDPQV